MEKINVNFQLNGIELITFNLATPETSLNQESTYNFDINIEHRINSEEKLVNVLTSIDVIHEESKQSQASIKTSCIFVIPNLHDFISGNSKQINLPDQFVVTLNSISLSTTRGIMFSQFKGTFLHHVILPIINPSSLVTTKAE